LSNLLNCQNNKLPWMMPSYLFEECWRVSKNIMLFSEYSDPWWLGAWTELTFLKSLGILKTPEYDLRFQNWIGPNPDSIVWHKLALDPLSLITW
jgi:hypothetical protein